MFFTRSRSSESRPDHPEAGGGAEQARGVGGYAQTKSKFCVVVPYHTARPATPTVISWSGMPKKRRKAATAAVGGGRAQRDVNSRYARPRANAAADVVDAPVEGGASAE